MGYVNPLEGIIFVLTNDASTTMMPGEHDQAIGLQRLESQKDSVSRLETFESLWKSDLRLDLNQFLEERHHGSWWLWLCFRKKTRAKKRKSGKIFCEQFFSNPKKGGSLIAIFKSYHFESFLRWGVNGLSSIQLAKTRPKPTGGFRWSFWSSWTSTRLICHGGGGLLPSAAIYSASKIHPQK